MSCVASPLQVIVAGAFSSEQAQCGEDAMTLQVFNMTAIQEFYRGRSVLITGATGFCGKSLLEKLLRSCPDIGNIFLLMRPKKGQDVEKRLAKLFTDPVSLTFINKI